MPIVGKEHGLLFWSTPTNAQKLELSLFGRDVYTPGHLWAFDMREIACSTTWKSGTSNPSST